MAGHVIEGAWLSSTTMICVQELELPQPSCAVQVLVIVRSCGHIPPTVTSENPIIGFAVQLSVAVALPVFAGKVLAVQLMVVFGGHVIAGAWLSSTKMV